MRPYFSLRRCGAFLLLASALACNSVVDPDPPPDPLSVTLRVTNATCTPGPCQALEVLAFPLVNFNVPAGPRLIHLGTVTTSSACLIIPATATFGVTDTGTGVTTTDTWTTAKPASLGIHPPNISIFEVSQSTASFVPRDAPGWSVTLPTASNTTAVTPAEACSP